MTKTRDWPVRAMYMLIAAALVISLIIVAVPAQKVAADPDLSEWGRVSTPSMMDDWVVAPKFSIGGFAAGATAIYVIGEGYDDNDPDEDEDVPQLLKSTDGAATWKNISTALTDEIDEQELGAIVSLVKVGCDYADPSFLAVAVVVSMDGDPDELHVFISDDGGTTFRDTDEVDIPANGVFDFAVSGEDDGVRNIAIAGTDWAGGALLFRCLAIGDVGTGWEDATTTAYKGWDNGGADSAAVVAFKFAPSWARDNTVLVLTVNSDLDNVYLQSGSWGTVEAWNDEAGFEKAVAIFTTALTTPLPLTTLGTLVAGITTPLDYSSDVAKRYAWVNVNYLDATDTPVGEIFRVKNKSVIPINQQIEGKPWLTNVSYLGYISEGRAIAGLLGDGTADLTECCEGVQVYRNNPITDMDICCLPWDEACKPPTGRLAMAAFYVSANKAYAVGYAIHDYDEGAWSVSFDDGDTWNQLSLVNTQIDYLSDVAVSPDDCNKTMLVSVNLASGCTCDSVWLKAENLPEAPEYSKQWLRTWCGQLENDYGLLRLAPEETTGDTVYLVDRGTSTIYWNERETMACWKKRSATSIVNNIVDLAVKDESTIYALGQNGAVAVSDDHGAAPSWTEAVDSEVNQGWTIAVLGEDILVGGRAGDVSYSADGGETFTELKDGLTDGVVTVAFDSYFNANDTVYAAVFDFDDLTGGVYRWVIDESTKWRDLKAEPFESQIGVDDGDLVDETVEVGFTGLVLDNAAGNPKSGADTGGVLYASYVTQIGGDRVTGVARNLRPAAELCCEEADWDYLIQGLTPNNEAFYMMPKALKICGCLTPDSNSKLFAIDGIYGNGPGYDMAKGNDGTVWSFEDCYAKAAPALTSPAEDSLVPADPCECINLEVILRWDRQCDACSYDIQVALDEDFTELVVLTWSEDTEEYTPPKAKDPSYVIARRDLNCDQIYYWRVRSSDAETGQIIHSWWSEPRSFKVAPGPNTGIEMVTPEAGATAVAITNIAFTWDITASADEYDWVLSANTDLSAPVETKTGLTDARHTFTGTLEYETPYYWTVTAYKDGTPVDQATSTFTTMAEPIDPGELPAPATPIWVWVVIAIGAVLVIVVIVLIFRTRRV